MVNWTNLPYNLLQEVLDKLLEHKDHAIFSSICRNWQSVCKQHHNHRLKLPPLLLIPTENCHPKVRDLYSISEKKCLYKLRVPRNQGFYTLSYGWFACLNRRMSITLINPFTTAAKQIRTPPLDRKLKPLCDIMVHRGLVFALNNFSNVIAFDVNSNTPDAILQVAHPVKRGNPQYLVETSRGELLLIVHGIAGVKVYKLILDEITNKLVDKFEVTNLGTDAVFISYNNTFCVPVTEHNGCQPNSIYFCRDNIPFNNDDPHMMISIFNLVNQDWTKLYQPKFTERQCQCYSWVELPLSS